PASEYPDRNDLSPIESPAQAWNVLTVGACTEKCNITSPAYAGWQPLGAAGDLSPCSRTSISWQQDWPIKPDLVLEGGGIRASTRAPARVILWMTLPCSRLSDAPRNGPL